MQYVHYSSSPQKRKPPDPFKSGGGGPRKSVRQRGAGLQLGSQIAGDGPTARPGRGVETDRLELYRGLPHGRRSGGVSRDRCPNGRFRRRLGKRSHLEPRGRTTVSEKYALPPLKPHYSQTKTTLSCCRRNLRKVRKSRSRLLRGRRRNACPRLIPADSRATEKKAFRPGKAPRPYTEVSGAPSDGMHPAVEVGCAGREGQAAPGQPPRSATSQLTPCGQSLPGLPKFPKHRHSRKRAAAMAPRKCTQMPVRGHPRAPLPTGRGHAGLSTSMCRRNAQTMQTEHACTSEAQSPRTLFPFTWLTAPC